MLRSLRAAAVAASVSCCLAACGGTTDDDGRTAQREAEAISAISIGDHETCTLTSTGRVSCARIGEESRAILDGAIAVSAGHGHSCAVRDDGRVVCFGDNTHGQLGDGTFAGSGPTEVVGVEGAVGVAAGFHRTCAWTAAGEALCWGTREHDPHRSIEAPRDEATPRRMEGLADVKSIALGGFHGCALLGDGAVKCWGANYFGQLGDGTETLSDTPRVARISGVTAIAAGTHHTCALAGSGVFCWGADLVGQLGEASTTPGRHHVTPTVMPSLRRGRAIAAAGDHTCVLLEGRSAPRCWGFNDVGQVSPGKPWIVRPPTIPSGVDDVTIIASGSQRSCALHETGDLRCWGQ